MNDSLTEKTGLGEQLENDFARAAASDMETRRKALETMAARQTEPVTLFEGGVFMPALAFLVALFFLWWAFYEGQKPHITVACLIIAILGLAYPIRLALRRKKPLFTMNAQGIIFPGTGVELPWHAIEDYHLHILGVPIKNMTTITFFLCQGAAAPQISGDRRVKYLASKNLVQVRFLQAKGLSNRKLDELIAACMTAGHARAALSAL